MNNKITKWFQQSKNKDGTPTWVFNHIEDGHCAADKPTIKHPDQKGWNGNVWRKEHAFITTEYELVTLDVCPFCGHQPYEDNLYDSIHPINRNYDTWCAGCLECEGGCGAQTLGDGREGAIASWNRRVV